MIKKVIVITGIGGMGLAIARRIGTGYKLILADFDADKLANAGASLRESGYDVQIEKLDVSDQQSVENLSKKASQAGEIHSIVHTAGLSPNMSKPDRIIEVNILGTARIIAAFEQYLSQGTVGIMISSMSAYLAGDLNAETEKKLATLLQTDLNSFMETFKITESATAYALSKKANLLQVQAAAVSWGKKGARILSISPGIISTQMGISEREKTPQMDHMLKSSPVQRIGTPEDIAGLVDFLQSPAASFLTGTDILIDGGVVAYIKGSGLFTRH